VPALARIQKNITRPTTKLAAATHTSLSSNAHSESRSLKTVRVARPQVNPRRFDQLRPLMILTTEANELIAAAHDGMPGQPSRLKTVLAG
jgi:hypothetical protein